MPPELPLLVASEDSTGLFKAVYDDVVGRVKGAQSRDFIYAGMKGFVVANAPGEVKILHTSGAFTCTVMLVHMRRGVGALGHFYAAGEVKKEVGGIVQMVEECRKQSGDTGDPVSIALSATYSGGGFVEQMIAGIKSLYPACSCEHVGTEYDACVYVPQLYRAAFCSDTLRGNGPPHLLQKLTSHEYDGRDAPLN